MALEGSIKDFGLADILQLIYFQRKDGVLTVEGNMDRVSLLIIGGNIVGAESKKRMEDNRIGRILYKKGLINETDLRAALEEQQRTGARLGNILMSKALVERETIQEILKNQITETVIQLFGWKDGTYKFSAQSVHQDKGVAFSIDTQHLLMEGLRIIDELALIKGKIALDSVFAKKIDSPENLSNEETEVFSYIDGENDLSTIIDLSSLDSSQVSKTVLSLVEKGVIETVKAAPAVKEKITIEKKRPIPLLNHLPALTIIVSLCVSAWFLTSQQTVGMNEWKASKQIEDLRFKIKAYRLSHAEFPPKLDYITAIKDPWGNPYIYRVAENTFFLASQGVDGREATADDIF